MSTDSYNTVFKEYAVVAKGNLDQIAQDFHRSCSILSLNGVPCQSLNYETITPHNIIDILESQLFWSASPQLRTLLIDYCILYLHQGGLLHSLQATIIGRLINYDYNFPSLVSITKKAICLSYDEIKNQLSIQEEISGKIKNSIVHIAEESKNLVPNPFPLGANLFEAVRNQTLQFRLNYNASTPILDSNEIEIDTRLTYHHPAIQAILDEKNEFEKEIGKSIQKWCKKNEFKTSPHAACEFVALLVKLETNEALFKEKKIESYLLLNQTLQFIRTLHTVENSQEPKEKNQYSLLAYLQHQQLQILLKKLTLNDIRYHFWIEKHLSKNYSDKFKTFVIKNEHFQQYLHKIDMLLMSKQAQDFAAYLTQLSIYAADSEVRDLQEKLQMDFFIFIVQTATAVLNATGDSLHAMLHRTSTQFNMAVSQSVKEYMSDSTSSFVQKKVILILRHLLSVLPFIATHFIQNKILRPKANPKGILFKTCQAQSVLNTMQPIAQSMILTSA